MLFVFFLIITGVKLFTALSDITIFSTVAVFTLVSNTRCSRFILSKRSEKKRLFADGTFFAQFNRYTSHDTNLHNRFVVHAPGCFSSAGAFFIIPD